MASTWLTNPPYSNSHLEAPSQSQAQSQRSSSAQQYQTKPIAHHNTFVRSASHPTSPGYTKQDEKNFIVRSGDKQEIIPPEKIEEDDIDKQLGFSSRKLRVTDFELIKTLGTGASRPQFNGRAFRLMPPIGTFARVWLTRLANPKEEDKHKVFALKVLRKVDGMRSIHVAY